MYFCQFIEAAATVIACYLSKMPMLLLLISEEGLN
jgi:hypothetical protein